MADQEKPKALSNGSPTSQKTLLKKIGRILESVNIILLVVTHWLQSLEDCSPNLFQGHATIKWIYYACQVMYALTHMIDVMEFSSGRSLFRHAKTVLGSVGFELILWAIASHIRWTLINICVVILALACPEFINLLRKAIQPFDDDPFSKVDLNIADLQSFSHI